MRDLEEIKRINSEPGVGDKLGPLNGRKTYSITGSKSPWEDSDPIDHNTPNLPGNPQLKAYAMDAFDRGVIDGLIHHGRVIL